MAHFAPEIDLALISYRYGCIKLSTLAQLSGYYRSEAITIATGVLQGWARAILSRRHGTIRERLVYSMVGRRGQDRDFLKAVIARSITDNYTYAVREYSEIEYHAAEASMGAIRPDTCIARQLFHDAEHVYPVLGGNAGLYDVDFAWLVRCFMQDAATPSRVLFNDDMQDSAAQRLGYLMAVYADDMLLSSPAHSASYIPHWLEMAARTASHFGAARDLNREISEGCMFITERLRKWPLRALVSLASEDFIEQLL